MQRNRTRRQNSRSRVVVGDSRHSSDPQPLDQRLEREKIEGLLLLDRTAECSTELMAVKVRNRLVLGIEEILRIERGVAVKLEAGAVDGVGARPRHRVDHTAGRSSEFGRVRVREHLKLEDAVDPKKDAGR